MDHAARKANSRILIVDDESHVRRVLGLMLERAGHQVSEAPDGHSGLAKFNEDVFDLVFLDLRMPDLDGLEVLSRIRSANPDQTVVMITAYASVETALTAMKSGAFDYIGKPFKEEEILLVVDKALERTRMLADNLRLRREVSSTYDFSNIIGSSQVMLDVFGIIRKVADTKATVLITGESGTGKELVAKAIHYNSRRKKRPLVAVNCAAIPANLMESELFGHVRGAFTGAERTKAGLFEEADGSSLFLDEIGELPLEVQAKLLRALQDGEIKRVGDSRTRTVDIRVMAATNLDLAKAVAEGKFREDLYYRLNVIPIHLPDLNSRNEDIPLLAVHFLKQASQRHEIPEKRLSQSAMEALVSARFPGNVRELANNIEQALLMSDHEVIELDDLPLAVRSASGGYSVRVPAAERDLKKVLKTISKLAEKQVIGKALQETGDNRTHAAEVLGISRRALITKIQDLDL